ncbi:MAG TPA: translocation/assembly module TamB domain-containing protein [Caulobacteraceae bacterium]|nr:translocation/assembly module TamB domain-containing protein [Caulobacteraceae bacterium]
MTPEEEARRARRLAKISRRWSRRRVGTTGFLALLLLVLLAGMTVRLGVLTDTGRAIVVRLLDNQKIARFGRLHVDGFEGDIFGTFTVRRLSIADAKGPWLRAGDVTMRWRPAELILRRVHAERLRAGLVQVLRRPELSPVTGKGGQEVSVRLDDVRLRLETLPAFSSQRGLWDLAGQTDIARNGAATGKLDGQSRLHAGDSAALLFQLDPKGRMLLRADAVEGAGGALAGGLGLPADQRLFIHARIDGSVQDSGTLAVVTESGTRRPVVANGTWNKQGASLDARILLDASKLTAEYSVKVGPEVRVLMTARQLRGDLYQVDASARGKEAFLVAKGPVDWRRRSTAGLSTQGYVSEIRRWLPELHAGAARQDGVVSGALARWRWVGRGQLDGLDQFDYRLVRAAGPTTISHEPGDYRLQADLTAAGGSGQGLLPALLGASPHLKLDGSRVRGGRILIRLIDLDGAGLKLKAAGDRNFLGVISLKGDAVLSGLERAHPGAKGRILANWTARQSGANPWDLVFDAKGEAFATGWPELDRLLGPTPRLEGAASYGAVGLSIARSQITGGALMAATTGAMRTDGGLALSVIWSAKGPFAAGPIEIAGEARGTGAVGGRLSAPTLDLGADLASIDFGRLVVKPAHLALQLAVEGGLNGQVAVTGPSEWGPASGKARFRVVAGGLDLNEIAADAGGVKASGALALRDGAPSTADLAVSAGPGAFLAKGRLAGVVKIVERPGGAAAQLSLDGENLALPGSAVSLKTLKLRADGPWNRLPFQVSTDGDAPTPWRFAGDGMLTQTGAGAAVVREIALSGAGRVRQADVRTLEPAVVRFAPGRNEVRLRASVGAGRAELDARQAGAALEAKGAVTGVDLAAFASDYMGTLSGDLSLTGQGDRLNGVLQAAVEGGRNRDAPAEVALSGKVRATLSDTRVRIDGSAVNPQGLTSKLDLDIPAEASASPFRIALVRNRPVDGAFTAEGELRPLWDLFAGGARSLSGKGSIQATLGGTLNGLKPTGRASVEDGRFQDAATGLDLKNLAAQASFDLTAVEVSRFSGDDGVGGRLSGMGRVSLAPDGASTFSLQLQRFRLLDNDLARAVASGSATVIRDAAGKARLEGALTIDRADITAKAPVPTGVVPLDVIEINRPGADSDAPAVRARGPQIALDVTLKAARGLLIRGNGLDAELSLDAHVGGTTAVPELTGLARVVRGDYQFAGKRFEFDETGTVRLGSRPETIRLNLIATREDPTLRAIVRIQGTAARPEITLSSVPVLPQDEVLSQVLFGRSAAQLSPLEAAQLASAVTALATGGGFDVLGGLRQFARLDRLSVAGGGATGAATVSGGKYVTDDVYLELTGGGRNGPTAQVEWRVRRNFSLVSTVGAQGDARLSVRFRHNY